MTTERIKNLKQDIQYCLDNDCQLEHLNWKVNDLFNWANYVAFYKGSLVFCDQKHTTVRQLSAYTMSFYGIMDHEERNEDLKLFCDPYDECFYHITNLLFSVIKLLPKKRLTSYGKPQFLIVACKH